jgi:hypothetical protein
VLICALLSPRGAPARLYLLWLGGEFELVVCPHLLAELEGVLRRPRFRDLVAPDEVGEFVDVIRQGAVWAENLVIAEAINRDPGDDYPSPWPRPPMSTTSCLGTRTQQPRDGVTAGAVTVGVLGPSLTAAARLRDRSMIAMGPLASRCRGDRGLASRVVVWSSTCFCTPGPRPGPARSKASSSGEFKTDR